MSETPAEYMRRFAASILTGIEQLAAAPAPVVRDAIDVLVATDVCIWGLTDEPDDGEADHI